jgi:hypothetical protein
VGFNPCHRRDAIAKRTSLRLIRSVDVTYY